MENTINLPDTPQNRLQSALNIALRCGSIDGEHHKMWVIDQMVRALTGCPLINYHGQNAKGEPYVSKVQGASTEYEAWVKVAKAGEDGSDTYKWNEGIAP